MKSTLPAVGVSAAYIGAGVCTRTQPRCDACPIADDCIARIEQRIDELPARGPRKELPRRAIKLLLLERGGRILLEQRPPLGIWGGLWSLPELAVDGDVAAYVASRFNATAGVPRALPPLAHAFTHFALTMHPVSVSVAQWSRRIQAPGIEWFTREAALAAALPAPIRKLLQRL